MIGQCRSNSLLRRWNTCSKQYKHYTTTCAPALDPATQWNSWRSFSTNNAFHTTSSFTTLHLSCLRSSRIFTYLSCDSGSPAYWRRGSLSVPYSSSKKKRENWFIPLCTPLLTYPSQLFAAVPQTWMQNRQGMDARQETLMQIRQGMDVRNQLTKPTEQVQNGFVVDYAPE